MNQPDRFAQHVLGDDEQPCVPRRSSVHAHECRSFTVEEDSKIPNAATLTINKEDHTLAGMLRSELLLSPHVLFCGYQVPHPLEPRFVLKIQTDGHPQHSPLLAVDAACKSLIITLSRIKEEMELECTSFLANRPDADAGGAGVGGAGYGAYAGFLGQDPLGQGGFAEPEIAFE